MSEANPERLQKVIAGSGLTSRRAAEKLITDGRVTVNGVVAVLGQRVDDREDRVEVDGVPLPIRPELTYYLLNKPAGVVSTAADPQGRRMVVDLVPREVRVYPVGRLDRDSEGLLILTNDGDLTQLLTHPSHRVPKRYVALVEGQPAVSDLERLVEGIDLPDGKVTAESARLVERRRHQAHVEIVMAEGRKREVRRMCEAIGFPVISLFRSAIGPISDPQLRAGEWRYLTIDEVRALYAAAARP